MEQFGFWYVDGAVKQWQSQNRFARIITPESLAGAPHKAIALLRNISLLQQSQGLKVEDPHNRMHVLAEMGLGAVGEVVQMPADGGRTTDYVIPIESGGVGQLQIVVNPAWGVQWRLSSGHPLAQAYAPLSVTHNPDLTPIPEPDDSKWGYTPYLAPEVLAQVTHPGIVDIPQFAADLRLLVADMLATPGTSVSQGGWSLGLVEDHNTASLDIRLDNRDAYSGISLHLGQELGLKHFGVYGYPRPEASGALVDIAQRARMLDGQIDLLHKFTQERETR